MRLSARPSMYAAGLSVDFVLIQFGHRRLTQRSFTNEILAIEILAIENLAIENLAISILAIKIPDERVA